MRPLVEKGKTLSELRRLRRLFSIRHHICVPVTPRSEPKQPGFDGLGIVARPGLLSGEDRPNLPAGRFARGDNGGRWKPEQTKEEVSLMRMFRVVALSAFVAVPVVAQAQGVPGGINYGLTAGPIPVTACSGRSAALLAVSLAGRLAVSLVGSTAYSESILTSTTAATIGAELKEPPLGCWGRPGVLELALVSRSSRPP
jgi:hypothetical protein